MTPYQTYVFRTCSWVDRLRHGMSRLTEDAVRDIRAAKATGERSVELGRRYGVHAYTVDAIAARRTWRHIP